MGVVYAAYDPELDRKVAVKLLRPEQRDRPGRPLAVEELFQAGWPGERILAQSAAGRVYVALTTLRNLGLREFLQRRGGGYLLDAGAPLEVHDVDPGHTEGQR